MYQEFAKLMFMSSICVTEKRWIGGVYLSGLLWKFENVGELKCTTLKCMEDYLRNRQMRTVIKVGQDCQWSTTRIRIGPNNVSDLHSDIREGVDSYTILCSFVTCN